MYPCFVMDKPFGIYTEDGFNYAITTAPSKLPSLTGAVDYSASREAVKVKDLIKQ